MSLCKKRNKKTFQGAHNNIWSKERLNSSSPLSSLVEVLGMLMQPHSLMELSGNAFHLLPFAQGGCLQRAGGFFCGCFVVGIPPPPPPRKSPSPFIFYALEKQNWNKIKKKKHNKTQTPKPHYQKKKKKEDQGPSFHLPCPAPAKAPFAGSRWGGSTPCGQGEAGGFPRP